MPKSSNNFIPDKAKSVRINQAINTAFRRIWARPGMPKRSVSVR